MPKAGAAPLYPALEALPNPRCSQAEQGRSEVAARLDGGGGEPQPPAQAVELGGQLLGGVGGRAGLGVRRLHDQPPGPAVELPVGLEVDPPDDPVAEQEGQHVVAVDALLGRHVDLDPVVEVEERLGAGSLPHDRVEGAQQCPGVDPARQPGVAVEVGRPAPALDRHREQLALLDERGHGGRGVGDLHPVVVTQVLDGRDAVGAGGAADQLARRPPRGSASAAPARRPGAPARAGRSGSRTGCCGRRSPPGRT